jgi:hypothetical protein
MGGNVLDRLVPEAEREHLCAENVLVSHTFAYAGR